MSFSFHPEAEKELNEAVDYYEEKEPGLGYDFAVEAYAAIQRSVTFPKAWPIVGRCARRSLLRRFPYGILYQESGDEIFIVAVMHLHREPGYWVKRH